jgi:hypothetical protein
MHRNPLCLPMAYFHDDAELTRSIGRPMLVSSPVALGESRTSTRTGRKQSISVSYPPARRLVEGRAGRREQLLSRPDFSTTLLAIGAGK